MFTGLIDDVGVVARSRFPAPDASFASRAATTTLTDGESIAVNGACLTVREHGAGWFTVAAVTTTLGRTTIGDWTAGRRVNLERALQIGDRLGGHFVQGHVDGVATVVTSNSGTTRGWLTLLCRQGSPSLWYSTDR